MKRTGGRERKNREGEERKNAYTPRSQRRGTEEAQGYYKEGSYKDQSGNKQNSGLKSNRKYQGN